MPIENEFYGYDFYTDTPKKEWKIIPFEKPKRDYRDRIIRFVTRLLKWAKII
jgi:hypothetical protein